tara:strand:- start:659 stop:1528 length:870 start_codon:yes stop_codon:yes gene_type:complete
MGNRRRIRRFNVIIIIMISMLFCKVNYQSLLLPENLYNLSCSGGGLNFISYYNNTQINIDYSTSLLKYPDNIYLYNINIKNKYRIAILDFGRIEDKINNNIIHSFQSYEILGMYRNKKQLNKKINLNIAGGIIYSKIDALYSSALFTEIGLVASSKKQNLKINFFAKNLGLIINKYSNGKEYMPPKLQVGVLKNFKNKTISIAYDFLYDSGISQNKHIISMKKKLNQNLYLLFGINSYKADLKINNTINDFLSGFSMGLIILNDNINIEIGTSYLGPAGYVYGLTFSFI